MLANGERKIKMNMVRHRNSFGALLKELNLNGFGIEIGVATGNYSEVLLNGTELKKIYFLDPWREYPSEIYKDATNCCQKEQDGRYNVVVGRLKKYGDRAIIVRKDSVESLPDFANGYFDFVYIDANHAYEYVKIDINNWYPKLKVGGVFAGHDYFEERGNRGIYGVKKAVDEFCKERGITPFITGGTKRCPPSWYFIKNKE